MKKSELIKHAAAKTRLSEEKTKATLGALISVISEALEQGEAVNIDGLGKFYLADYKGRDLRSPQGQIYHIKDKKIPRFKASNKLKAIIAHI